MLALLADENFDNDVIRGVRRREPRIDVVRVQDVGLDGVDDRLVLEWAAREGRVVLSHDKWTMIAEAYKLLDEGRPMAGLIEVAIGIGMGHAIDEIVLLALYGEPAELSGQVHYVSKPPR